MRKMFSALVLSGCSTTSGIHEPTYQDLINTMQEQYACVGVYHSDDPADLLRVRDESKRKYLENCGEDDGLAYILSSDQEGSLVITYKPKPEEVMKMRETVSPTD